MEQRDADAAAVGLLEIETEREIVVERDVCEEEGAGRKVFVALCVRMEDIGFHRGDVGHGAGLRDHAVRLVVVQRGAGAGGQPVDPGRGADEVDAAVEGGGILGGATSEKPPDAVPPQSWRSDGWWLTALSKAAASTMRSALSVRW